MPTPEQELDKAIARLSSVHQLPHREPHPNTHPDFERREREQVERSVTPHKRTHTWTCMHAHTHTHPHTHTHTYIRTNTHICSLLLGNPNFKDPYLQVV